MPILSLPPIALMRGVVGGESGTSSTPPLTSPTHGPPRRADSSTQWALRRAAGGSAGVSPAYEYQKQVLVDTIPACSLGVSVATATPPLIRPPQSSHGHALSGKVLAGSLSRLAGAVDEAHPTPPTDAPPRRVRHAPRPFPVAHGGYVLPGTILSAPTAALGWTRRRKRDSRGAYARTTRRRSQAKSVRRRCFKCCTTDTSTRRRSNPSTGKVVRDMALDSQLKGVNAAVLHLAALRDPAHLDGVNLAAAAALLHDSSDVHGIVIESALGNCHQTFDYNGNKDT
ncbi:hypothetical protein GGX14DRAFT_401061 [Mycena pura]|uniref:Uncharacterized protein n=1 Tax=Mycena pura TaxID=153505 RepID=A0AAD6V523_9AGAR|nr:hypothetical protein GGX14DRAFT_401061 [Mycena pura]